MHTPGPWKQEGFGIWSEHDGNRRVACTEYDKGDGVYKVKTEQEAIANARLIAAAPDLLAACKAIMVWQYAQWDNRVPGVGLVLSAMVDAAIAKAEGQVV